MLEFVVAGFVLCVVVSAPLLLMPAARRTGLVLMLALPIAAAGVYALLGTPAALDPVNVETPESLDDAIVLLERRLADEPDSVEGWVLLGRARAGQERYADARDAFAKAVALLPDDPDLLVEYADLQMRAAAGEGFPAEATAILERVVAAHPTHQRALFYLGAQRFQAGNAAEAAAIWERLLPLVEAKTAAALRPQIDAARAQAGLPPLPDTPAPAAGPALAVAIDVAPEIAAKVPAGATLFVFARPVGGAGPPVAAERIDDPTFPLSVTLDDADAVMPTATLSQQAQVEVSARLSAAGDAIGAAGDLESAPGVIAVGEDAKIALSLDRIRE